MDVREHLLTCLIEEGVEVFLELPKTASKCLRFGLEDRNVLDPGGPTNRQRLVGELNDLMGVVELLEEAGVLPPGWLSREKIGAKKAKVAKFMAHAQGTGALVMPSGGVVPEWGTVSPQGGKLWYRHDIDESSDGDDELRDCQEMLRGLGYEIEEPQVEHDCISGDLRPFYPIT